jgi:uncharacterized protein (TIGR00290 family)
MEMEKVVFFWSGGKDSALALYKLLKEEIFQVVALITTVNQGFQRISMHGVSEVLLEKQAEATGIPLIKMYVSEGTNAEYEKKMEEILTPFKQQGISKVIFGDIFLEDLRIYRERNLSSYGFKAIFPLWKQNSRDLINEFIDLGFKTITCCVNSAFLDESWAGKVIDESFIRDLPANVDPCGENGEFHTFCFDGPVFSNPIEIRTGQKIFRPLETKTNDQCELSSSKTQGFIFCDLLIKEN